MINVKGYMYMRRCNPTSTRKSTKSMTSAIAEQHRKHGEEPATPSRSRRGSREREDQKRSATIAAVEAILASSKSPTGCSGFVRNPVRANELCYHTKFDVPDSTTQSKFPYEVVSTKCGSHTQMSF